MDGRILDVDAAERRIVGVAKDTLSDQMTVAEAREVWAEWTAGVSGPETPPQAKIAMGNLRVRIIAQAALEDGAVMAARERVADWLGEEERKRR